jgi:hypothetical protein
LLKREKLDDLLFSILMATQGGGTGGAHGFSMEEVINDDAA